MKKILSLILSAVMLFTVLSGVTSASAKDSAGDFQYRQFNSQHADFNYKGKTFVKTTYNTDTQKSTVIISASPNKSGKKIKAKGYVGNTAIDRNYVYYIDYGASALMRVKKNGKGKKAVIKCAGLGINTEIDFIIDGKYLIYNKTTHDEGYVTVTSSALYVCKTNGKGKKKIASGVEPNFFTYKGNLYYLKNNRLVKYNLKKKKSKKIKVNKSLNNAEAIMMVDKKFYIAYGLESPESTGKAQISYGYIDVKTGKYTNKGTYSDYLDPVHEAFIYNDSLYLSVGTGGGNAICKAKNGTFDFDSYDSLYDNYKYSVYDGAGGIGYYNGKAICKLINFMKSGVFKYSYIKK